jgi:large subunit ribosomal protein L7/L12
MKSEIIIENLKSLTLIETSKLVSQIEIIFGVSAAMQTTTAILPQPVVTEVEVQEEKTNFDVILTEAPFDKRISILKTVRNITGLGLKESKEIVDNVPRVIKEGLVKNECESIKKELELAGAKVVIK